MAQEQEQNRTEQATPFKLREARRRGQVAKSLEINSFAMLCVALALVYFAGAGFGQGQLELSSALLRNAHRIQLEGAGTVALAVAIRDFLFGVYWPVVALAVVVAIAVNVFQTGPVFSFHPLKPDVQRLNPVNGFKRIFSKRLVYETGKTLLKFGLFAGVAWLSISSLMPVVIPLVDVAPQSYGGILRQLMGQLMFQLLLVALLVALFDLMYTRWDFGQQMRMSRRELREEIKRREGDPLVRAKMRELQKEAVKRAGATRRVPDADVLITNPTHLAVALHYDAERMIAPAVIAKGAGTLAGKMREVAFRSGVPIVENKALAQRLFRETGIDESVPDDLYPVVAKLLAWVLLLRRHREALAGRRA
jgi:flagellar biosynthetic protein FlhB